MKCGMCGSINTELFLDLGYIPIVDNFLTKDMLNETKTLYPLNVHICKDCGLSQLSYIVPANKLFNENYAYESSTTKGRRDNHNQLAEYVCKKFDNHKGGLVVDIGSNVGVLLECFKNLGMKTLGIDASANIVKKANERGITTILGFFNSEITNKILETREKASIVTATNLFAHIQDYESFVQALKNLLLDDGIFVFQVPHFLQLIKNLEYDTIYHEHITYLALKPLIKFFAKHEMDLFDVIETDIDGGCIRCFVCKKGKYNISTNIQQLLKKENDEQIYDLQQLQKFARKVKQQKQDLLSLLIELKKSNKKVIGVGAPAKGITLLNYCKIDSDLVKYITEKAPLKIGKYTPGTHIPVVGDEKITDDKPDYALLLSWNFSEEIMKNLRKNQNYQGKFIIPIPYPQIV